MTNWLITNADKLTLWVGAICTIALYSALYKENRLPPFRAYLSWACDGLSGGTDMDGRSTA